MVKTPQQLEARRQAEIEAGEATGHTQKIEGATMDDTCVCSCGWRSRTYWDGDVWAYNEWVKHIEEQGTAIAYPKEQFETV
jgi:hypothetical protein